MRLIDADALYKAMQDAEELARRRVLDTESTLPYPTNLNPAYTRYLAQMDERTKAKEMVADAPTVDAVPVVHGEWQEENRRPRSSIFYCSICHRTAYDIQPTRDKAWKKRCRYAYCPNCGAKMDGKDGDGNG